MSQEVKSEICIGTLKPRHRVNDSNLVERLKCDMKEHGWKGRPLLVAKVGDGYEGITGCHRAIAAMEAGIPIPVVVVSRDQLTEQQWRAVMYGEAVEYTRLDSVFEEAGLHDAAELMRQKKECGNWGEPVEPPKRPRTTGRRIKAKRTGRQ